MKNLAGVQQLLDLSLVHMTANAMFVPCYQLRPLFSVHLGRYQPRGVKGQGSWRPNPALALVLIALCVRGAQSLGGHRPPLPGDRRVQELCGPRPSSRLMMC